MGHRQPITSTSCTYHLLGKHICAVVQGHLRFRDNCWLCRITWRQADCCKHFDFGINLQYVEGQPTCGTSISPRLGRKTFQESQHPSQSEEHFGLAAEEVDRLVLLNPVSTQLRPSPEVILPMCKALSSMTPMIH